MRLASLSKTRMVVDDDDILNLSLDDSFNLSIEEDTSINLSESDGVFNEVSSHAMKASKNLGVGKVNSTIQEVLRVKGRGGVTGFGPTSKAARVNYNLEDESDSEDGGRFQGIHHGPLHEEEKVSVEEEKVSVEEEKVTVEEEEKVTAEKEEKVSAEEEKVSVEDIGLDEKKETDEEEEKVEEKGGGGLAPNPKPRPSLPTRLPRSFYRSSTKQTTSQ